jgi:ketosteroid isomerase-like protein
MELPTFLDTWTAAERDGDVATLESLLTDDFVGVGPLGFTLAKPAWLARHRGGGLRYETYDLDEVQARVHGEAAVVTARQTARGAFQGRPTPEVLRTTLALVHDAGDWRLAGVHFSFVAGAPGAPPIPGHA